MCKENGKQETNQTITVKITKTTNVKPKEKIGRKECQLVTFDLPYLGFFYNQKLLIYKGNGGDYEEMVERLKDGLSKVLEEFYQLAGKLARDDDGVFKIVYDDDMDGVEVSEAYIDCDGKDGDEDGEHDGSMMVTAEELASKEISFMKELIPYNGIFNLEGTHRPLLAIQLTKLRDGMAMGCAFNHAILDGTSTWHFMSSWADICCGASSISIPPFLDRTKARSTRVSLNIPDAPPQPESVAAPPLRERLFKFSETAIEKIKSSINSGKSGDNTPFSTFQTLSTHIWRAVTAARGLKPQEPTVFTIFVDCRKRVSPPVPESYFGNLIQAVFTGTAAGMVTGNPPEFAANMIQAAIRSHDAATIEKRNKEFEGNPFIFQYKDAGMNCVAVGSSPRFKVYDVDFGFGKPERVRSGTNNRFDGMVYLYPGKDGGKSIDVEISLEVNAMEELEKNKDFLLDGDVV
ncbi:hypothetical protein vseg_001270 [Gypsophila vaccaria]